MPKKRVTADELIARLNEAYENQEGYDAHNRFDPTPENATGKNIRGYSTASMWTAAHQRAHNAVFAEYELDVAGGA